MVRRLRLRRPVRLRRSLPGDYTVTYSYTDSNGCSNSDTKTVTVNPLPIVSVNDEETCAGYNATLTADTSGTVCSGSLLYAWYAGSSPSGTILGTDPTYSTGTAGTYTCKVTCNTTGCSSYDSATVTVYAGPTADFEVDTLTICNGTPVTFTDLSSAVDPATLTLWQWDFNNDGMVDRTDSSASVSFEYTYPAPGTYTISLTVTDSNGCSDSETKTDYVTVYPLPNASAGPNVTIDEGESIIIGGSPTGSGGTGPYTYSWTPATDLSDPSSPNPIASPDDTTTYTVIVTDSNGCSDSDSMTVTITSPAPSRTRRTVEVEPICYFDVDMLGEVTRIYVTCDDGRCIRDYSPEDPDELHFLDFESGTEVSYETDRHFSPGPPRWIRMRVSDDPPSIRGNYVAVSKVYDFIGYTATGHPVSSVFFDRAVGMQLDYDPDNLPDNTTSVGIAMWDPEEEEWIIQPQSTGRVAGVGTATADVTHFSTFVVMATTGETVEEAAAPAPPHEPPEAPTPARFTGSNLLITPLTEKLWGPLPLITRIGHDATISVTVTNAGEEAGVYTAELKFNDETLGSQDIRLAAGESSLVQFQVSNISNSEYEVELAELTDTLTVYNEVNWWLSGTLIALVLAILAFLFARERKRRRIA